MNRAWWQHHKHSLILFLLLLLSSFFFFFFFFFVFCCCCCCCCAIITTVTRVFYFIFIINIRSSSGLIMLKQRLKWYCYSYSCTKDRVAEMNWLLVNDVEKKYSTPVCLNFCRNWTKRVTMHAGLTADRRAFQPILSVRRSRWLIAYGSHEHHRLWLITEGHADRVMRRAADVLPLFD